jgi:hypothetical protein
MRTGATLICVLTSVLAASCGDDGPRVPTGPSVPGAPTSPIVPGRALISMVSRDEECGAKSTVWGFLGPNIFSGATVSAAANEWVARTDGRARGSDFEIRFRLDTSTPPLVIGTMRGTAVDLLSTLQFPNPSRVAVSGDAAISGTAIPQFTGIFATVTGTLSYTDNQGGVTTCGSALLTLYTEP